MKKFIFAVMIALTIPFSYAGASNSGAGKKDMSDLSALIREYKSNDGFDCVSVGGVLLSLARTVAKAEVADDPDAMAALSLLKGVNHITVADYESCSKSVADSFSKKAKAILQDFEMLMEAKDGESSVVLYGTMSNDAKLLKNVIVFAPQDQALICIEGKISMDDLGTIMESAMRD